MLKTLFLFLSHGRISYPRKFTSESTTVWSSFDSVIPIIAALVLLAIHLISSFFEIKLLMFICRKCKNFLLSGSHMVDLISGDLRIGPGFRLTTPDDNKRNLVYLYKIVYKNWYNFYILD